MYARSARRLTFGSSTNPEVHLDVLRAQTRVAQDERHKTAIELAERKQKIYSLKMKSSPRQAWF